MRYFWEKLGIISFWLLAPALFFYLRLNARTRVVIQHQDKVLLVKPWLGSGVWDLPGGGLHISESPANGAVREVFEETGIEIKSDQLKSLGYRKSKGMFPATAHCFYIKLTKKPKVKKQFVEIIDIRWVSVDDVHKYSLWPLGRECFDLWRSR